jgi:hypothetical protein
MATRWVTSGGWWGIGRCCPLLPWKYKASNKYGEGFIGDYVGSGWQLCPAKEESLLAAASGGLAYLITHYSVNLCIIRLLYYDNGSKSKLIIFGQTESPSRATGEVITLAGNHTVWS